MHHEDRDAHNLLDRKPYGWGGGLESWDDALKEMSFHPPTINEMLESRRQQEVANARADRWVVGVCVAVLFVVVAIVLFT